MEIDDRIEHEYAPEDKRFRDYRDRYNIIKKENIVDDGNIKFFIINRSDLDDIIRVAYVIKNRDVANVDKIFSNKSERRKLKFYELDLDALSRIQVEHEFILGNTSGLDTNGKSITYRGIIFENNEPTNKQAHLIINDLDKHFSSIRFAFSAYKLMHKNEERYSIVLQGRGMVNNSRTMMHLDTYFENALSHYLNGS